jgi:hypothetical protein
MPNLDRGESNGLAGTGKFRVRGRPTSPVFLDRGKAAETAAVPTCALFWQIIKGKAIRAKIRLKWCVISKYR